MEGIRRELFPIVDEKPYFNTCSIGPLATPVKQSILSYIQDWNIDGGIAWVKEGGWTEIIEQARTLFASIIGTKPENIAYSFGNSVAFASIMLAFDFSPGDTILFNDLDFPSFPTHIMAQSSNGVNYKVVESNNGRINISAYENKIDVQTRLITACEVASNTGSRINAELLVEIGEAHDIPVFLDTYQSTGVLPMDVEKLGVDFLASGCLKWLIGGFGISFLYVRDDWMEELEPTSIGWMGVEDPFKDLFDKLRTELHRPSDATKFQYGTPYPIGAVTAAEGMRIIKDIGVKQIYRHDMDITDEIIAEASSREYQVQTPAKREERGSIVNIVVDNAGEIVNQLQEDGFILDMRSNGIRVAPHFFTSSSDIIKLFDRLDQLTKDQ